MDYFISIIPSMIAYLDLLSKHRNALMGFAMLWIMVFHIPELSGIKLFDFIQSVGYGGVDIFLFLSGFGLYFAMLKYDENLKKYYKKRFIRIMPEFWFVLCVVYLLQMDFSLDSLCNLIWDATTLTYWIGEPHPLWFISFIIVLYAIYPIYYRLFKKYGIKVPASFICLGLVFLFIYAYIAVHFYDNRIVGGLTIFSFARIPIFFIGSIFGYLAKDECNFTLRNTDKALCFICFFLAIIFLGFSLKFAQEYLCTCSLYFLPFIVITPVLCVFLAVCFEKIKYLDKLLAWIGTLSLELFMCHVYLFKSFYDYVGYFGMPLAFLLLFLLSVLLAVILNRLNDWCMRRFFA